MPIASTYGLETPGEPEDCHMWSHNLQFGMVPDGYKESGVLNKVAYIVKTAKVFEASSFYTKMIQTRI
jgi:hypothetical protein